MRKALEKHKKIMRKAREKRLKLCSNQVMQSCLYRLMRNKSELIEIQKLYNVGIN
jgi:hypothetical protein